MKNYIVRNCPACILDPSCCAQWHINNGNAKDCSDITDCVLKRIVEVCEAESEPQFLYERDRTGKAFAVLGVKYNRGSDFAQKILQLLEIEEVDEK